MSREILVFGGTFDPPNKAHIKLISYLLSKKSTVERLVIVPAQFSPLKKHVYNVEHANHRLQMLRLALATLEKQEQSRVIISDYELTKSSPSYTINTLRYFQSVYKYSTIAVAIGDDHITLFTKWYQMDKILTSFPILIFCRNHLAKENQEHFAKLVDCHFLGQKNSICKVEFLENPIYTCSSSNIRNEIANKKVISQSNILCQKYLQPQVRDYIAKYNLYASD